MQSNEKVLSIDVYMSLKNCPCSVVMPRKKLRWRIKSARQQLRQRLPRKWTLETDWQDFRLTSELSATHASFFKKNYFILVQRRRRRQRCKVKYFSYHNCCLTNRIKFSEGQRRQPQSELQICVKLKTFPVFNQIFIPPDQRLLQRESLLKMLQVSFLASSKTCEPRRTIENVSLRQLDVPSLRSTLIRNFADVIRWRLFFLVHLEHLRQQIKLKIREKSFDDENHFFQANYNNKVW